MSTPVKIVLYIALVILAIVSGTYAFKAFGQLMAKGRPDTTELEQVEPERKEAVDTSTPSATEPSNTVAAATATNTTTAETSTNQPPQGLDTNSASVGTNTAPDSTTNLSASAPVQPNPTKARKGKSVPASKGHIGIWAALLLVSILGLGLLIATDVSQFFGNRALKVLYNDEGEGVANPEYEVAEQTWANGDHLEAIRLMRDYLNKNPREQFVALRIAEIYEKDLNNNLAAALEYEEVLKHKLPPERWGWAAIHLCNLYFKLNQEQKGYDLLRKIVQDYSETPAAEKARKRLEQVGGMPAEENITESQVKPTPQEPKKSSEPPPPESNLPPGFRPKK